MTRPRVLLAAVLATALGAVAHANEAAPDAREFSLPLPETKSRTQLNWDFPALRPLPLSEVSRLGKGISRTLALLQGSTPQKRNQVRIVVYGQSLSKQSWATRVQGELLKRYPHADIQFHNLAIGGFPTPLLKRTVEQDVISLYPDLVILHAYGREDDYEQILQQIRTRTTAELLLQNDPGGPSEKNAWRDEHSWQWMPAAAARWGAEVVDVRTAWRHYMADQHLRDDEMLRSDKTHLNDQGNFLFAEATLRHLQHPAGPALHDTAVRTFELNKDVAWRGNKLALTFTGNRVDVIADARGAVGAVAQVRVDGKAPSQWPELYTFTRPNADANRDWPWETGAIIHVDRQADLLLEDWTIEFTSFERQASPFAFNVTGSKTGYDGSGESNHRFVSNSGRVVLAPQDWFIQDVLERPRANRIQVGYKVTFSVRPQFVDTYIAPPTPDATRSYVTTLAQGLPAGQHVLELIAPPKMRPLLKAIRVYTPMLKPLNAAARSGAHKAKSM